MGEDVRRVAAIGAVVLAAAACAGGGGAARGADAITDRTGSTETSADEAPGAEAATDRSAVTEGATGASGDDEPTADGAARDTAGAEQAAAANDRTPTGGRDERFAVPEDPDDIDPTYVDLVVNRLLSTESEVFRSILARRPGEGVGDDEAAALRAVTSGRRLVDVGDQALRSADDPDVRDIYRDELGTMRWDTDRVLHTEPGCVVAVGRHEVSETAIEPYPDDERALVSLSRLDPLEGVEHELNPTPWRVEDMTRLIHTATSEPVPEQAWDALSLPDIVSTTCETIGATS